MGCTHLNVIFYYIVTVSLISFAWWWNNCNNTPVIELLFLFQLSMICLVFPTLIVHSVLILVWLRHLCHQVQALHPHLSHMKIGFHTLRRLQIIASLNKFSRNQAPLYQLRKLLKNYLSYLLLPKQLENVLWYPILWQPFLQIHWRKIILLQPLLPV